MQQHKITGLKVIEVLKTNQNWVGVFYEDGSHCEMPRAHYYRMHKDVK